MPAEIGGYFYWQIYWLSPNLLADMVTFTKCGSRNEGKQVLSPNLPADLLTVSKSAGRFAEFDQICWQKCGGQYFCWQINWLSQNWLAKLLTPNLTTLIVTKSGSRFLPSDLLTVTKSAGNLLLAEMREIYLQTILIVTKSASRLNLTPNLLSRNGGYFCWH